MKSIKKWFSKRKKSLYAKAKQHPFISLFTLLGVLIVLIVIGNIFRQPPEEPKAEMQQPKTVDVYRIGAAPRLEVQAQVEKSGVITITALSPGVVQNIYVEPGTEVSRGTTLLYQSTNYQGGNALALQADIAARQLQNVNETYDTNKELIEKQREVAQKTEENSEELRDISAKSIDETEGLLAVNDEILSILDDQLENAREADDEALILQTQQLRSQFISANNQLRSSLRNTKYSSSDDEIPADLEDLQKDITLKQLDIQEKALNLNRDVSRLQLQVAQVQAATMTPSSPFNATVQRVFVKVGEAVQPGTPLVVLSQKIEEDPIVAIAYVPREIARKASYLEPSVLSVGDIQYESYPSYITQDAIQGTLYGIYYPIPDKYHQQVTDNGYINVDIPIGYFDTGAAVPYIPIDSVYQTEESSYVFIVKENKAVSTEVELGAVTGRFVEVQSGLSKGDTIILNRDIVSGDVVEVN